MGRFIPLSDTPFPDSESNIETLGSVSKALDVLEVFSYEQPEMALGEIAAKLQMGKSTVHKVLQTLLVRGFVAQDASTRRYRLGLRNWHLGNLAIGSIDLRAVAAPYLKHLAALTGEQLTLWVIENGWAVCVDRVESRHSVRNYTRMGTVERPEDFASGRCLLAFSAQSEIESAIERVSRKCGSSAAGALGSRLDEIRGRGYETNPGDIWEEIRAIAAPLFDHSKLAGSVSVSGPKGRFDEGAIEAMVPELLETTAKVSAQLGHLRGIDTERPWVKGGETTS